MKNLLAQLHTMAAQGNKELVLDTVVDYANRNISGSYNVLTLDVYQLHVEGFITAEHLDEFVSQLLIKLIIDNELSYKQESKYVYNIQSKARMIRIISFTKLQCLIFKLYHSNYDLAMQAMAKLTDKERDELNEVLGIAS